MDGCCAFLGTLSSDELVVSSVSAASSLSGIGDGFLSVSSYLLITHSTELMERGTTIITLHLRLDYGLRRLTEGLTREGRNKKLHQICFSV